MQDYAILRRTMVDTQIRPSDVTKFPIIDAMLKVRREAFVPDDKRPAAYVDELIDLGEGRFVLDPRSFAKMLDALDVQPTDMVLDIGCGLGYSSAILAQMAGTVIAIEENESFVETAQATLVEQGCLNVVVNAAPLVAGDASSAPYDVILIQGGVEDVPQTLLDQLADGGRLACIFQNGGTGILKLGYKIDGQVSWRYEANAAAPVLSGFEKSKDFVL